MRQRAVAPPHLGAERLLQTATTCLKPHYLAEASIQLALAAELIAAPGAANTGLK